MRSLFVNAGGVLRPRNRTGLVTLRCTIPWRKVTSPHNDSLQEVSHSRERLRECACV